MLVSDKKIEVPDECPKDCKFMDDIAKHGQNSICCRCPILNCKTIEDAPPGYSPILEPEGYRSDWAREWKMFFDGEIEFPRLLLEFKEDNIQE